MTCDLQVIQSQLLYSSRREPRVCRSGPKKLICCFPNASWKTPQFISVAYDGYALKLADVWILLCSSASLCVLEMGRRRKYSDGHIWDNTAVRGGFGSVHVARDVRFYCDGCGAVLSGLVSWAAGGLLLQGALLPKAGELLKSSSSSRPLVASYWVFSKRVIRRSSSSPNSPPIRVGSPTTITSCQGTDGKSTFTPRTLAATTGTRVWRSNLVFVITAEVSLWRIYTFAMMNSMVYEI